MSHIKSVFFLLFLVLSSCGSSSDNQENVDGFVNGFREDTLEIVGVTKEPLEGCKHNEKIIYTLNNNMEVWVHGYGWVDVVDENLKELDCCGKNQEIERWKRAKVGQQVYLLWVNGSGEKELKKFSLLKIPNYTKKRIVQVVNKYDGHLERLNGNISGHHLLFSGGIEGNLKGEDMGSQDFFINLYFTEGEPLSVNAKENPLWLDIQAGDTVIESRTNGIMRYVIKRKVEL